MHVCTCGDCETAPFEDRCKYEARLAEAERFLQEEHHQKITAWLETAEERVQLPCLPSIGCDVCAFLDRENT